MEVQPMTVIVNTGYGFPRECGSTICEVKKNQTKKSTTAPWILNSALILVSTNFVSHVTTDSAVLKIWFQWCNNSNVVSI